MKGSPFKLTDLPDNTWSVSWPKYEHVLVSNLGKCQRLLHILFDVVKVETAKIGTQEKSNGDVLVTSIPIGSWLQDPEGCANYLSRFNIPGCVFDTIEDAEKFKLHLEQRLMWARLSNQKTWSEDEATL